MNKEKSTALGIRKSIKKKKPEFIKPDYHKRKEIKIRWRRAKGKHAKTRLHKKGRQRSPEVGFRSPLIVRGLTRHGLKEEIIQSANDIEGLDKDSECATIAKSVGTKKRIEIVKKAGELGIKVTNVKKNFLEETRRMIEEKKRKKASKMKEKVKRKEVKKEAKPKTIEDLTEEEKKKAEKAEKDKILIRREE